MNGRKIVVADLHLGWHVRQFLVALCGLIIAGPSLLAQTVEISDEVDANIRARIDHEYNVGIIVGIIDQNGRRYYPYGETESGNGVAPDENTVFEIGSITKVFTSILLAAMVGEGEVELEEPIENILPEGVTAPTREGQSITLYHLATHTSGLARLPSNFTPATADNPYADYTVDQMYQFLSAYSLTRDIGSRYEYSNYAVGLLGNLLASRRGGTYEDVIVERITRILGMEDTRITLNPGMQARLAQGHAGTLVVSNWDIPALAGAGALLSTANDMLTFLAANNGLEKTPLQMAMTMTHESQVETATPSTLVGLGWHIRVSDQQETIWHNGGTGGYRSFAGFVRGGSTGIVVLTNSNRTADDIGFHLLDPTFPLWQPRVAVDVDPAILQEYTGRYELAPSFVIDVSVQDGRLTAQLTGQQRFPLYAESDSEFFYTVVDAQITFVRNEAGDVDELVLHQGGRDQQAKRIQ
jgi:CubicO group peptidase (beta-lactamase class C family)